MAQRLIDFAGVKNILQSRVLVPASAADNSASDVKLRVQGNGNVIDVTDGEGNLVQSINEPGVVLQKKIFNAKANSELAMKNERNIQLLRDAVAAERAGDPQKASDLFSRYLNAVQLSFSILLPNAKAEEIRDGVQITAHVEKVTTTNGSLLTLDAKTIAIVAAAGLSNTSIDLDAMLGDMDEDEAPEATPVQTTETKAQAIARIKADLAAGATPLVNPKFPELTGATVAAMA